MISCTFFGHRNTPEYIRPLLRATLTNLIETKGVSMFYVGDHGNFDGMALATLRELKKTYSHIDYVVVLAYFSTSGNANYRSSSETLFPEGLETVPRKYAIDHRNRWMINRSDFLVTYVTQTIGGAAKYKNIGEKKGLQIINLASL